MNKEILEEKAQLYALGALPDEEVGEFEERIRADRETQSLVHGYQRLVELDASEDGFAPSFHVYAGIMERIEEDAPSVARADESAEPRSTRGALVSFFSWGGWAAAACVALVFAAGFLAPEKAGSASDIVLNELGNPRIVPVQTPSEEFAVEDRMLELAGLAEAYWFAREGVPQGQLLADESVETNEFSEGFTIFDRKYNIGFIAVENLPREAPNKSYHVWAKFDDNVPPMRAGTLPIGDDSRGLFFFDLSDLPKNANMESLRFFVTEENAETPSSPSEMIVLSDV